MKPVMTAALGLLMAFCAAAGGQTRRALLIGINLYQPPGSTARHPPACQGGRCDLRQFENLDGAVNDVALIRDLLTSAKFGFEPKHVTLLTNPALPPSALPYNVLPPGQTTHDGLLDTVRRYVVDEPAPGDSVVFYFAGHGSLRVNSKGTKLTLPVHGRLTHADSTLVASDVWSGAFDVRDRELSRLFHAALDKGIHLTVILDSCHSGAFARGRRDAGEPKQRSVLFDPRDIAEGPDLLPDGVVRPAPTERRENAAIVFSAAQQDQSAAEISGTAGSETHGAFTVALVSALTALPATAAASVVEHQVRAELEAIGTEDQTPWLDSTPARREQPLFGGAASGDTLLRAAVVASVEDGTLLLDQGRLAGLGPGSELVAAVADKDGRRPVIRITELDGIARSKGVVINPAEGSVTAGELFDLKRKVPPTAEPLRVWIPSASPAVNDDAAKAVLSSGVVLVSDPASEVWTDLLWWDGSGWKHGDQPAQPLGPKLSSDPLSSRLQPGARVWIRPSLSPNLIAELRSDLPKDEVEIVSDLSAANYVLAGAITPSGASWTWMQRNRYLSPLEREPDSSPGCSASSPYPARTGWSDSATIADASQVVHSLVASATQLARLKRWLALVAENDADDVEDYYHLTLRRAADHTLLGTDQLVRKDERLQVMLESPDRVTERRWVYIVDIDCHGNGRLVYPAAGSENRFPNDAFSEPSFAVPGVPVFRVGPPYGVDTLVMLSTSEPLSDPSQLNFEAEPARGQGSTFAQILAGTSRGGSAGDTPARWGISAVSIRSVADSAGVTPK